MAFSEFTLDSAVRALGVTVSEADLFPNLIPANTPSWLPELLARGTRLALISEKSRSEFIVVTILLAAKELCGGRLAIFSGQRLDVDAARGQTGECDFILALGPSVPPLLAPIAAIVQAKKNDVEAGLGQCIAQMVAAQDFNAPDRSNTTIHGCVTTGEAWQFLRLIGNTVQLDGRRIYLDNVAGILGAISAIVIEAERRV